MSIISESRSTASAESTIEGILEWLALAHARTGTGDPGELLRQLAVLRDTPLPYAERIKLLDLFFRQTERTLRAGIPALLTSPLPVPRKLRYRTRIVLDALGILTQDYFNTLAELFAPQPLHPPHAADAALTRLMQAIGWRARLAYLAASPAPAGLWQQLHAAFRSACKLGLEDAEPLSGIPSIRRLYSNILLEGIAQPASFTAGELDFAGAYIAGHTPEIRFHTEPPAEGEAVFWIDPEKDFPAHALTRRHPDPSTEVLYFSCEAAANSALRHRTELLHGISAESLGLPTPAGGQREPEILWRLSQLWGHPAKRRFSRRRQSYRAKLSLSLDAVWAHLKIPPANGQLSEWMVINESPDGFALMHISGHPEHLEVGQLVALQAIETPDQP